MTLPGTRASTYLTTGPAEGLRLRQVADAVGIDHSTLHHHVATKQDLVEGVAAELELRARRDPRICESLDRFEAGWRPALVDLLGRGARGGAWAPAVRAADTAERLRRATLPVRQQARARAVGTRRRLSAVTPSDSDHLLGPADQPIPVTCSAVVQLVRMALRADDSVMVPAQTAFLSLVSVPSFVYAVGDP